MTVITMMSARAHSFVRVVLQVAHQALTAVGRSHTIQRRYFAHLHKPAERVKGAVRMTMAVKVLFCAVTEIARMERLIDVALLRK